METLVAWIGFAILGLAVSARTRLTFTVGTVPVSVPVLWLIAAAVVLALAAVVLLLVRGGRRDGWLRLRPAMVTR